MKVKPSDIRYSACILQMLGVLQNGIRAKRIPEEYEDDETEDGPVDYPMDGGEDGDDDDGDSSGDDAEDENEEDKEEMEEHLAPAYSVVVVPTVELVSPPKGTKPVTPPPSTDIITTGARITVRLQASISLPPEAEVERLLAMPTPPPSPLISLLPPFAGERFARDTWVDLAEAVPEITPMTVGEVNTRVTELAELHKHDTQDLYALLEDAHDSRTRISQRVTMNSQRVDLLYKDRDRAHQRHQTVHYELQTHREHVYAYESQIQAHQTHLQLQGTLIQTQHQVHETRSQMQQTEMAELRETGRRRKAQMVNILRVMRDMRREMGNMQAELLALREQQRRARQPGPDVRVPDHQDASRDADSHI
ncbi:hypothetical protein Tco_0522151 [Tanacetum coccineum]